MKRRSFLGLISAFFAMPSALFGKLEPNKVVAGIEEATIMNIPKKCSPEAQKRTVEIVYEWFAPAGLNRQMAYFTNEVPLGIKDLCEGDLFRLREPDGTLVSVGNCTIFKAADMPRCKDGVWGVIVESER